MVELVFEYGPRVGCWRLLRIFKRFDIKVSILGVVRGLQQYPELAQAFVAEGHEIVSHGWRWLDYHHMPVDEERKHIRLAFDGITGLTGTPPAGWFNGRPSINTRRLVVEHGGFLYDRDYLGDELPFWIKYGERPRSYRFRSRPTITASTGTAASVPPTSSPNTCATASICSTKKVRMYRR